MMTLEEVRTAVSSADPAGELDRLVEARLAAGKTTAEIYAALLPLARTIRKTTPLPEDVDEILLGTLDALTGHCNPDECYQDPPEARANGAASTGGTPWASEGTPARPPAGQRTPPDTA